jgi:hypothetical protein
MQRIVSELSKVRYIRHIVLALGRATFDQYLKARSFFDNFPHLVTFVWI